MDWNATPKRSTLASSFLAPPSPSTQQEASAYFSAAGSCKRRYAQTMEDAKVAAAVSGDFNSSNSLFLDCESLQHSLKRVRLSSSPGELRLQRDLRHLVLSSRWIPVDEDLWCLQQAPQRQQQQQQQQHGDDAAGAATAAPPCSSVQLQRLTTATLKMTVVLPTSNNNNNNNNHTNINNINANNKTTLAHVWLQIPRLYPHRPPVVTQITYSKGAIPSTAHNHHVNGHHPDQHHHHQHSPESVMLHHDVPTKDWFSGDASLVLDEQSQQQHSRIHSLVFTNEDENMVAGSGLPCVTTTPTTTVYAPWSPIQRLGDALDCIIEHLMAVHSKIPHSSSTAVSPSSVEQHTHTHTSTTTDMDNHNHDHNRATLARLSRFWHDKETASCSLSNSNPNISQVHTEADRATEIQMHRARSDSDVMGFLHGNNDDTTNVASFQPNRFDQGYERESPWSSMDVSI